jgi:hypothetical protein
LEGTLVLTPHGEIPIEKLRAGDQILTHSLTKGQVTSKVISVTKTASSEWVDAATLEHPFETSRGTFAAAEKLIPGKDRLLEARELLHPIEILDSRLHHDENRNFYNLITTWPNTFIAGGFLVHNKGCFLPETPILLADGTSLPISEVKPGMRVEAFTSQGEKTAATVKDVYRIRSEGYYELKTAEGNSVRVTAEHPFYVGDGRFRTVETLKKGDSVYLFDGPFHLEEIDSLTWHSESVDAYNLHTDFPNTFIANHFAVHNKGGGGGGGGFHGSGGSRGYYYGGHRYNSCSDVPDPTDRARCKRSDWMDYFVFSVFAIFLFLPMVAVSFSKKKQDVLNYRVPKAKYEAKAKATEKLLTELSQADPAFEINQLKSTVSTAFLTLQKCWQARNYEQMSPFASPAMAANHQHQIESMRRNHEINCIENVNINEIRFVHLQHLPDQNLNTFTAVIEATAKDFYVNDQTQAFIRGDASPEPFQEFWRFQRLQDRWLLTDIEQAAETHALTEHNSVRGTASPSPVVPSDKISRIIFDLEKSDPMWNLTQMKEKARADSLAIFFCLESQATEMLSGRATEAMIAEIQKEIEQMRGRLESVEFRNICARQMIITIARKANGSNPALFAARVSMHAQRRVLKSGSPILQDSDVVPFDVVLTYVNSGFGFSLDHYTRV